MAEEESVFSLTMIADTLQSWLNQPSFREERQFIEVHPELLSDACTQMIYRLIQRSTQGIREMLHLDKEERIKQEEIHAILRRYNNILMDIDQRGGTIQAIRDTYVNIHGGLALDIPPWLEKIEQNIEQLRLPAEATFSKQQSAQSQALEHYAQLINEAKSRAAQDTTIAQETRTELTIQWVTLPAAFNTSQKIEDVLSSLTQAVDVYTKDRYPQQFARVQRLLGSTYIEQFGRERQPLALQHAIKSYTQALDLYNDTDHFEQYATINANLANAYSQLSLYEEKRNNQEKAIAAYEEALRFFASDTFPDDYALIQYSLGSLYNERVEGERSTNLEHALVCYERARHYFTLDDPVQRAYIMLSLGVVYSQLLEENQQENEELAILRYTSALEVFEKEKYPHEYATAHYNLGSIYSSRLQGEPYANQETSIKHYQHALEIFTRDRYPSQNAAINNNLGSIYFQRFENKKRTQNPQRTDATNMQLAISHYQEALQVFKPQQSPLDYARTQYNLGNVYYQLMQENPKNRVSHLQEAIQHYRDALQGFTTTNLSLDTYRIYLALAQAETEHHNWNAAHVAYTNALYRADILIARNDFADRRTKLIHESIDTAANDSYTLVHQNKLAAAAATLENGCQRQLSEFLMATTDSSVFIQDRKRRKQYQDASEHLIIAQAALDTPSIPVTHTGPLQNYLTEESSDFTLEMARIQAYNQAQQAFELVIQEIRQAHDPADFLHASSKPEMILQAARQLGPNSAIIYLVATPWGGIAIGAFNNQTTNAARPEFSFLELPRFTQQVVSDLIESTVELEERCVVTGGFVHALNGDGFSLLLQDWKNQTLQESLEALQRTCKRYKKPETFSKAVQETLLQLKHLASQPLEQMSLYDRGRVSDTLKDRFLYHELAHSLNILNDVAINQLAQWLSEQRIQNVLLIPYGHLAVFPFAAVPTENRQQILGDRFTVNITLSAQSLIHQNTTMNRQRSGVYALGDPTPSFTPLPWGQAQAQALVEIARSNNIDATAKIKSHAKRESLISALASAFVVSASCYCILDNQEPLQSRLVLASGEVLTIGDIINKKADLAGLRLLMLSTCQSRISGLRELYDEVQGFATIMLQVGTRAVLTSYWKTDDEATYLLTNSFAKEWFPRMHTESPSVALGRAKKWLREQTNQQLSQWQLYTSDSDDTYYIVSGTSSSYQKSVNDDAEYLNTAQKYVTGFGTARADERIRSSASKRIAAEPNKRVAAERPFADPIYWAGFQVFGW